MTIVRISEGSVRGQAKNDVKGEEFLSFEGIPYGEPPIGKLRFKAPLPVKSWDGVKDALSMDLGNLCKHLHFEKNSGDGSIAAKWIIEGSEDCLNLNVYTRKVTNAGEKPKLKPVMVYIHGGAFTFGNTRPYGPEILMTEDVVLVTVHYRLGAFGFLVLEDPELEVPGNAGLKDIVLSLKWVNKNIVHFNGDPNNVTLFGHSAGASAVSYVVLSQSASGLFHKAIIQSGCGISSWAMGSTHNAKTLAKILNCNSTDEKDILDFLQSLPAHTIYEGQLKIKETVKPSEIREFSPVVERQDSKNPFLTEDPIKLFKSGKYNQVPIMIGYTDMEAIPFLIKDEEGPLAVSFEREAMVPHCLNLQNKSKEVAKVADKIWNFYYDHKEPELISLPGVKLVSDVILIRDILKQTQYLAKTSKHSVYLYRFRTPMEHGEPFTSKNIFGVPHGAELGYLFKMDSEPKLLSGNGEIVQKRFLKMWINFVRYGNPTPAKDDILSVKWEAVEENRMNFLDISDDLVMEENPENERMAFWDELFEFYLHSKDY